MKFRYFSLFLYFSAIGLLFVGCNSPVTPLSTYPEGVSGTITISGAAPKAVTTLFGQNYWCWDGYGNNMPSVQTLTSLLKLNILRAGGYNNDAEKSTGTYGSDPFGQSQIDGFVAFCHAVGAEPVIQVPLIDNYKQNGGTANPTAAAALVTYANITKGYGVKYWEIGNEPDLYSDQGDIPGYSVANFCADFNSFAAAMKAVDSSIKILGPELSWKYPPNSGSNDWLTPFLTACSGKYDIVSIHRYPFAANGCTIANAMGDVSAYKTFVQTIQSLISSKSPGTPFAITEANFSYDGDLSHSIYAASPQTLYSALWVADNLCASRELGLWAQHYWSLSESWTIGFIDPNGYKPRPEYYAFQMVSNNMGPVELSSTYPAGFSVYASRNSANNTTAVIVINKNSTNNSETFIFSNMAGTPVAGFSYDFPAYSICSLAFPDDGSAPVLYRYSLIESSSGSGPTKLP